MRPNQPKEIEMDRQMDCPDCKSSNTAPMMETAWMMYCKECDADWDIRTPEEIEWDNWPEK